jgi:hypothetical protein
VLTDDLFIEFQIGARVSLLDSVNGAADKAEVKLQFSRKHFSPPANEDASDDLDGSTRLQSDDAELLAHVDLTTNDPERSVLFILRAQQYLLFFNLPDLASFEL